MYGGTPMPSVHADGAVARQEASVLSVATLEALLRFNPIWEGIRVSRPARSPSSNSVLALRVGIEPVRR
jgi:hypothetical protein